jgi:hypothetical protein
LRSSQWISTRSIPIERASSRSARGRLGDAASNVAGVDPVADLERAGSEPRVQTAPADQPLGLRRLVPLDDRETELGPVVEAGPESARNAPIDASVAGSSAHAIQGARWTRLALTATTSSGPSECRWRRRITGPAVISAGGRIGSALR